jgi:phage tail sheath protein FI
MPQYFHPGVYIEEIERGPRPIEGVPTSLPAFIGEAERGPIMPQLVTSYKDYQRWFGDVFNDQQFLPYAANGYFENGGTQAYICRVVGTDAASAQVELGDFFVRAAGAGKWGNRVFVKIEDGTTKKDNTPVGFRVRIAYWGGDDAAPGFDPFVDTKSLPRPDATEDFDDLVAVESSADYFGKRLPFIDEAKSKTQNQGPDSSALIVLVRKDTAAAGATPTKGAQLLTGGTDAAAALGVADYKGEIGGNRRTEQGLAALKLDPFRDVSLVHAPGKTDQDIATAIVEHCEELRFRFAVLDSNKGDANNPGEVNPRSDLAIDSSYAAYYFPWIVSSDPRTGARKLIPPGGPVLGVYARTDTERGVFKAPANEIVRGLTRFEANINAGRQAVLNPEGINALRFFEGRGSRVWGARTMTSDPEWKYVNVRRHFIYLEHSIDRSTQYAVFEPNGPRLWASIVDSIEDFLLVEWMNGALLGDTPEQAFFVRCDRTTMSQNDLDNGRLICLVGVAPVKPAEFVIFRIGQFTADAQV